MSSQDEMACRELVEVVSEYIEGRMSETDRARFDAHLEECPYCVEYVEQMRQTIEALGEVPPDSISAQTRKELLQAFRGWREP
jgi:anti-sigma factor RsiW